MAILPGCLGLLAASASLFQQAVPPGTVGAWRHGSHGVYSQTQPPPSRRPAPQLERMGHLYAATTDTLAQVVAGLDPARLVPYEKGDPAGIVLRLDEALGLRSKPL